MDIEDWRKQIDELDRKLVALLSERARAAVEIGRLKGRDLVRIYERIIDVMRNIQKEEIVAKSKKTEAETPLESDVND